MPRHIKPNKRERTALAPYNFVPLPNRVFTVQGGIEVGGETIRPWEAQDRFIPETHSGWIELTTTTLTPVYIRGRVTRNENGAWDAHDSRLRPEPYCAADGRPAIPGSSLRGMVRTLVEILSFAKIQPVSNAKPFFRTVANDRIGGAYRERMRIGDGVRGGIVRRTGSEWMIEPSAVLRVERRLLRQPTHDGNRPRWELQHKDCWVEENNGRVSRIGFNDPGGASRQHGTLVLTGMVPKKQREFVFLDSTGEGEPIHVPQHIWDRFHDQDQITPWQEQAFPRNKPEFSCRRGDGDLRDGEPVFFLVNHAAKRADNPDGLIFLGRAGMFRLPYSRSPHDLIPEELHPKEIDLTEAMFGRVSEERAIKGRVFFEDAVAVEGGPGWLEQLMVPRILSSPKPTTFQHYLTQDGTDEPNQLTTYLDGDCTTIRGHKLYWHRWDAAQGLILVKEDGSNHDELLQDLQRQNPHDKQHTKMQPVKAGVTFEGRVRFENLTDIELGALLEALDLPEGCHHRIGMGKPLGLGSIQIDAHLFLVDREARYRSWQQSGVRNDETGNRFREAFCAQIIAHARNSDETTIQGDNGLRQIARLDALYALLEWEKRPNATDTRYMRIEGGDGTRFPADGRGQVNEFRTRPVLPTSHAVAGREEPAWPNDPPRPATPGGPSQPAEKDRKDRQRHGQSIGRHEAAATRKTHAAPPIRPANLPKANERVEAELLAEKTKKGGWCARHLATGLSGPVNNNSDIPTDKRPGDRLTLIVAWVKERAIAFRHPAKGDDEKMSTGRKSHDSLSKRERRKRR